jgi:hypothetical protein
MRRPFGYVRPCAKDLPEMVGQWSTLIEKGRDSSMFALCDKGAEAAKAIFACLIQTAHYATIAASSRSTSLWFLTRAEGPWHVTQARVWTQPV